VTSPSNIFAHLAAEVANWFIDKAGPDPINSIRLQKLIYLAQGWSLAVRNYRLIFEPIEAWDYGPVVPTLHEQLKAYGSGPITKLLPDADRLIQRRRSAPAEFAPLSDEGAKKLLERVWSVYGGFSDVELTAAVTTPDGPWATARAESQNPNRPPVISPYSMRDFFARAAASTPDSPASALT
jgi:uncharacterized phage-associated protein